MTDTSTIPKFVSIADAAKVLSCSTKSIRRLVADGELPGYRIANRPTIRIKADDLIALARPIPSASVAHEDQIGRCLGGEQA